VPQRLDFRVNTVWPMTCPVLKAHTGKKIKCANNKVTSLVKEELKIRPDGGEKQVGC
jgi:hypothetical protein